MMSSPERKSTQSLRGPFPIGLLHHFWSPVFFQVLLIIDTAEWIELQKDLSNRCNASHYCLSYHQMCATRASEIIFCSSKSIVLCIFSQRPHSHRGWYTSEYHCIIQSPFDFNTARWSSIPYFLCCAQSYIS